MVWGCMNLKGVGFLERVKGNLNAEGYIDLLGNTMIPSMHFLSLSDNCVFQQDNATCHTTHIVQKWMNEEGINIMSWPAQSPDLNPTENSWDLLKRKVHEKTPTNLKELWVAIKNVWDGLPQIHLENLIESMPIRCAAVIKAKRGSTRY